MARPTDVHAAPRTAELCRLTVPAEHAAALARLSSSTGASQAFLRRKALEAYLEARGALPTTAS